jgi:circadian clock protein KaiA
VYPQLSISTLLNSGDLAQSLTTLLSGDRYRVTQFSSEKELFNFIELEKQPIDCLILQSSSDLPLLIEQLQQRAIFLPTVVLTTSPDLIAELTKQNSLMLQQRRLTDKLKERLGYLGVYYKRDPKNFLRHLPAAEKKKFLRKLKSDYSDIVLVYFSGDEQLNQKIDDLVNTAFFADVSVSQIVEIHMELIDEFSKQLKLEGRSDEILLDYRLTLIDTIAHLCEMYRRSIPRDS